MSDAPTELRAVLRRIHAAGYPGLMISDHASGLVLAGDPGMRPDLPAFRERLAAFDTRSLAAAALDISRDDPCLADRTSGSLRVADACMLAAWTPSGLPDGPGFATLEIRGSAAGGRCAS